MITRAAGGRTDRAESASEDSCEPDGNAGLSTVSTPPITQTRTDLRAPVLTYLTQTDVYSPPNGLLGYGPATQADSADFRQRRDRWHNPARSIQAARSVTTQLTSHRSTNGQVVAGWHTAQAHPAYKRGAGGSNPPAPTDFESVSRLRRAKVGETPCQLMTAVRLKPCALSGCPARRPPVRARRATVGRA